MSNFIYKGSKTKEISFPLGGIGTGCIGLSGNGRLIDWEIYNKPNKGSTNGFSHFAIKAEANGKVMDARVLNGDFPPPYTGSNTKNLGFGVGRETMAGVPHFKEVEFKGEYPVAALEFIDKLFPGSVNVTAFNPLIPLNDKDSSIPGAFFEIEVANTTDIEIEYTLCASLSNPFPAGTTTNTYIKEGNSSLIKQMSDKYGNDAPEYGDITISTDAPDVSWQEYWYRGSWFDSLTVFWRDFTSYGRLSNRTYHTTEDKSGPDTSSILVHLKIPSGQKKSARFLITWNFPNCHNYWNPEKCCCSESCSPVEPKIWKNYYAMRFGDSTVSAAYSLKNWSRLYNETLDFKNALFASTLPAAALDAISANISILKSPTVLRLEDGSLYGWEGCSCDAGCCEGSCTHVWNYAYALPFLFPALERSMRSLDYKYNQRDDGSMCFRLQLPLGRERSSFRACADGQFGGVLKTYRDWKISGDTEWLKSIWDKVEKSIDFAWSPTNEDKWDIDRDGVLEGRQHHTLDMELFGPNSWLTGFYLAALKAGAKMAEYLGKKDKAEEYMNLFEKGRKWIDENLFNGEFYYQLIDLKDKSIIEAFGDNSTVIGVSTEQAYWDYEKKEIKYQIGEGCGVDQIVAQWHANLCGLGDIFDKSKTKIALESIYKYNFKKEFRNFFNPCRLYSLNDEAGVVICDWPEGKYKPAIPVPYAEETMNGFEYQAAVHMIQEGLVDEGIEIIEAIRERYDGEKRNPWNEFECGSNYARSMASYSILNAFSGLEFDMVLGTIGFNPIINTVGNFKCFWSLDPAWGIFELKPSIAEISVIYGELTITHIKFPFIKGKSVISVEMEEKPIEYALNNGCIDFPLPVKLKKGYSIVVKYTA